MAQVAARGELVEVALLALRLGFTAFGGPAAHIAMLREEVVARRGWMSDERFLDMLGATYLIPGPNSTEMFIHIGRERAGWRGMIASGVCFILPAALIVLGLAWAYVAFGALPAAGWLLYGVKPVIIVIVAQALWGLLKTAVKGRLLAAVGAGVLALALLGANELALLFGGGALVMLLRNLGRPLGRVRAALPVWGLAPLALAQAAPVTLDQLFWSFLRIGGLLYGSGYVLLAFMRNEFVVRLGWLSNQQLLDAVAVGQFTPGPVFTTATFVGYLLAGLPGAAVATVAIFLPSFVFVAAINPLLPILRGSPWMSAFLDGVNVAAVGLMAAVLLQLGQAALVDGWTVALALVAGVILFRYRLNSAWVVLGGGLLGIVIHYLPF
ncbi:chromate efflux transporter [Chloroflexia bacterium SDU3-3]|nr:chromate efflux transporter [Chloroflexia bacterium SDU3-3]